MKKLMIAAVVAVMATVSQAVAINWSATGIVDAYGKSLLDSTQFSTCSAVVNFFAAPGTGESIATSEGAYSSVPGVTAQISGSWKTNPTPATMTQYYAQLVITDKDGNTLTSELASFTTTGSSTYAPNFGTGAKFDTQVTKFTQTGANYGWTMAAPEPTSGMLLLIGMAGLALRRRRA